MKEREREMKKEEIQLREDFELTALVNGRTLPGADGSFCVGGKDMGVTELTAS